MRFVCLVATCLALLPVAARAQVPALENAAKARVRDAGEYARQFAVPQDEAERRLAAQEESVPATERLAATYRARLTGIVIEHTPRYRIAVYLTGDVAVPEQHIVAGGISVPVVFRTGARATRERAIYAMTYHQGAIRAALPDPPGMGYDPRTGALVLTVGTRDVPGGGAALEARLAAIAGVPVELRVIDRVDVDLSPAGGARVVGTSPDDGKRYVCTTGFAVTDGARSAVTTAAHCVDTLDYAGPGGERVPLSFVGQWGWGYRDVQIEASADRLAPVFFADTAKTVLRGVDGARTRAATRAGDYVCHRGERTGYSCAVVELTDFAPAGDLCGGACLPTWVTVAGPNCKGGDSGSPVFSGTTAFGIVKGASYRRDGSCAFYFYMSVDYLPLGWSLLTTAAAPAVPVPDPLPSS